MIERVIQQAGALSLPRGYQQPGRKVMIEVKDENTLVLKFEPISSAPAKKTVDVFLVCVKEGNRDLRLRAQLRAIDETGHVVARWDASMAKFAMNNFHENYKLDDVKKACAIYFPGREVEIIDATVNPSLVLPEIVRIKLEQVRERANAETTPNAPEV